MGRKMSDPKQKAAREAYRDRFGSQNGERELLTLYTNARGGSNQDLKTMEGFVNEVIKMIGVDQSKVDMKYLRSFIEKTIFAGGTSQNAGLLARINTVYRKGLDNSVKWEKMRKVLNMPFTELTTAYPGMAERITQDAGKQNRTPADLWEIQRKNSLQDLDAKEAVFGKIRKLATDANLLSEEQNWWQPEGGPARKSTGIRVDLLDTTPAAVADLWDMLDDE